MIPSYIFECEIPIACLNCEEEDDRLEDDLSANTIQLKFLFTKNELLLVSSLDLWLQISIGTDDECVVVPLDGEQSLDEFDAVIVQVRGIQVAKRPVLIHCIGPKSLHEFLIARSIDCRQQTLSQCIGLSVA